MQNLISHNQFAGSKHVDNTVDPHNDLIAEYYECLIDCDDDQHICKRICKEVLVYGYKSTIESINMLKSSNPP